MIAKRDLNRRKYKNTLVKLKSHVAALDTYKLFQSAWSIDALQSERHEYAIPYLSFRSDAAVSSPTSSYAIHRWEIETILTLNVILSEGCPKAQNGRIEPKEHFDNFANTVNFLRNVENYEYGAIGKPEEIFSELHRIGQRQFAWQRGFASSERLYRFAYIYGEGPIADHFYEKYGVTVKDFILTGLLLYTCFQQQPWIQRKIDIEILKKLNLEQISCERAFALLSCDISELKTKNRDVVRKTYQNNTPRVPYLPCALRQYPVVLNHITGEAISPLPDIIMLRVTEGLYYDVVEAPQAIFEQSNFRFEKYVRDAIDGFFPRFKVLSSQPYGPKKAQKQSPDVLVIDNSEIKIVIECKATKLTHAAKFSEDPFNSAAQSYKQIVKGIVQIWRFLSDARLKKFSELPLSDQVYGIVLTMDSWMQMSSELQNRAIAAAQAEVADDNEITDTDKKQVIFCSMQGLSDIMFISSENEIFCTLECALLEKKYGGWLLQDVRRDISEASIRREFPHDIQALLPWWRLL